VHTISNPDVVLELVRLRSEQIRRDVRGDVYDERSSRSSWRRRRRRLV
jgi:hypothetical protein